MQRKKPGILVLAIAIALLAGCRVGVSVFDGGDVLSASNERNCFEGRNCEFTVDSILFDETFTAQPRNGFEFTRWRDGPGFLCGNSTNPSCKISLVGRANAAAIIASDEMGYLVPEFTCTGNCPPRLNASERGLDEALVAMEAAKDAVSAYVAANGGQGAPNPQMYGVNLGTTSSTMLRDIAIYPSDASNSNVLHQFYIVANVYRHVWGDTDNPWEVSAFSLSGTTNGDNSMRWECIPLGRGANYPEIVPFAWLPLYCRL